MRVCFGVAPLTKVAPYAEAVAGRNRGVWPHSAQSPTFYYVQHTYSWKTTEPFWLPPKHPHTLGGVCRRKSTKCLDLYHLHKKIKRCINFVFAFVCSNLRHKSNKIIWERCICFQVACGELITLHSTDCLSAALCYIVKFPLDKEVVVTIIHGLLPFSGLWNVSDVLWNRNHQCKAVWAISKGIQQK